MKINLLEQEGYITLMSTLIVGAIGLLVAVSHIQIGISAGKTVLAQEKGTQARAFSAACVEQALEEIRENISYAGTDNLSFALGSCSFTVIDEGGENRRIQAVGTAGDSISRILVIVDQVSPRINVSSWNDVADF